MFSNMQVDIQIAHMKSTTSDYESKGSLYGYCDSKGEALTLEEYARQAKWTLEEYSIVLTVKSDNYKIVLGFVITSIIIQH